jgi:hypothetical protein
VGNTHDRHHAHIRRLDFVLRTKASIAGKLAEGAARANPKGIVVLDVTRLPS